MSDAFSHSGDKLYISTTPQNDDLTDHVSEGFPSLSYTEVKKIGSVGEYGINTNVISYDTWGRDVNLKAKGTTNAGDPAVECARDDTDAGQIAMRAAGAPTNKNSYAFKVEKQDGSIDYLRGLVMGPNSPSGRNEDFDLHVFTLGLQQAPVHIVAP
jgi:hypothetical protein